MLLDDGDALLGCDELSPSIAVAQPGSAAESHERTDISLSEDSPQLLPQPNPSPVATAAQVLSAGAVRITFADDGPLGIEFQELEAPYVVAKVHEEGLAHGRGLQPGDLLTHVNDKMVDSIDWDSVVDLLGPRPMTLCFHRSLELQSRSLVRVTFASAGRLGIEFKELEAPYIVANIFDDGLAHGHGILAGDQLTHVNEHPVDSLDWDNVLTLLGPRPMAMCFHRTAVGGQLTAHIAPAPDSKSHPEEEPTTEQRIHSAPAPASNNQPIIEDSATEHNVHLAPIPDPINQPVIEEPPPEQIEHVSPAPYPAKQPIIERSTAEHITPPAPTFDSDTQPIIEETSAQQIAPASDPKHQPLIEEPPAEHIAPDPNNQPMIEEPSAGHTEHVAPDPQPTNQPIIEEPPIHQPLHLASPSFPHDHSVSETDPAQRAAQAVPAFNPGSQLVIEEPPIEHKPNPAELADSNKYLVGEESLSQNATPFEVASNSNNQYVREEAATQHITQLASNIYPSSQVVVEEPSCQLPAADLVAVSSPDGQRIMEEPSTQHATPCEPSSYPDNRIVEEHPPLHHTAHLAAGSFPNSEPVGEASIQQVAHFSPVSTSCSQPVAEQPPQQTTPVAQSSDPSNEVVVEDLSTQHMAQLVSAPSPNIHAIGQETPSQHNAHPAPHPVAQETPGLHAANLAPASYSHHQPVTDAGPTQQAPHMLPTAFPNNHPLQETLPSVLKVTFAESGRLGIEFKELEPPYIIAMVHNGGLAEGRGIQAGDLLTHVKDQAVDALDWSAVQELLLSRPMSMSFQRQSAEDQSAAQSPYFVKMASSVASVAGSAAQKAMGLTGADAAKDAVDGLGSFATSIGGSLTSNFGSLKSSTHEDGTPGDIPAVQHVQEIAQAHAEALQNLNQASQNLVQQAEHSQVQSEVLQQLQQYQAFCAQLQMRLQQTEAELAYARQQAAAFQYGKQNDDHTIRQLQSTAEAWRQESDRLRQRAEHSQILQSEVHQLREYEKAYAQLEERLHQTEGDLTLAQEQNSLLQNERQNDYNTIHRLQSMIECMQESGESQAGQLEVELLERSRECTTLRRDADDQRRRIQELMTGQQDHREAVEQNRTLKSENEELRRDCANLQQEKLKLSDVVERCVEKLEKESRERPHLVDKRMVTQMLAAYLEQRDNPRQSQEIMARMADLLGFTTAEREQVGLSQRRKTLLEQQEPASFADIADGFVDFLLEESET